MPKFAQKSASSLKFWLELVVFNIRTSKNNMEYRRHIDFFALEETRTTFQNLHCFKWFLVYCEAAAASIFAGINHCFQEILWQGMLLFIYFPKKLMRTHAMSIDQSKMSAKFKTVWPTWPKSLDLLIEYCKQESD